MQPKTAATCSVLSVSAVRRLEKALSPDAHSTSLHRHTQAPSLAYHAMSQHESTLSRDTILRWIAQGEVIVVYEGCALQLGAWIGRHPGGRLAILHMVGRDATDEINA
jgi:hypothetical protein